MLCVRSYSSGLRPVFAQPVCFESSTRAIQQFCSEAETRELKDSVLVSPNCFGNSPPSMNLHEGASVPYASLTENVLVLQLREHLFQHLSGEVCSPSSHVDTEQHACHIT